MFGDLEVGFGNIPLNLIGSIIGGVMVALCLMAIRNVRGYKEKIATLSRQGTTLEAQAVIQQGREKTRTGEHGHTTFYFFVDYKFNTRMGSQITVTSQQLAGGFNTAKTNDALSIVCQKPPPENLIVCYDQQDPTKCELKISMESYIQEAPNTGESKWRILKSAPVNCRSYNIDIAATNPFALRRFPHLHASVWTLLLSNLRLHHPSN